MQGEREEHDVVGMLVAEMMDVRAMVVDFGKSALNFRAISIVDAWKSTASISTCRADLARELDDQPGNIAGACGEIDDASLSPGRIQRRKNNRMSR